MFFIDRTVIADWGCQNVSLVMALPGVAAVLVLFVMLMALGRYVGGRGRWFPADIITGWGLLTLVMTLAGIYLPISLSYVLFALGVLALFSLILVIFKCNSNQIKPASFPKSRSDCRESIFLSTRWIPAFAGMTLRHYLWLAVAFVLQLWVLLLINWEGVTFWDDFSHWTLNALYLWHNDAFPSLSMPKAYSVWPAYPYALPYLSYAASIIAGAFLAQGGAMINWLLLTATAWTLTETHFREKENKQEWLVKLSLLGLAQLLVTVFNPGFNASYTVSKGSDKPTAVVAAFIGPILMQWHGAFSKEERGKH